MVEGCTCRYSETSSTVITLLCRPNSGRSSPRRFIFAPPNLQRPPLAKRLFPRYREWLRAPQRRAYDALSRQLSCARLQRIAALRRSYHCLCITIDSRRHRRSEQFICSARSRWIDKVKRTKGCEIENKICGVKPPRRVSRRDASSISHAVAQPRQRLRRHCYNEVGRD